MITKKEVVETKTIYSIEYCCKDLEYGVFYGLLAFWRSTGSVHINKTRDDRYKTQIAFCPFCGEKI